MSVFKDFPGLENLEQLLQDFQGLSSTRKSPAVDILTTDPLQVILYYVL